MLVSSIRSLRSLKSEPRQDTPLSSKSRTAGMVERRRFGPALPLFCCGGCCFNGEGGFWNEAIALSVFAPSA